MSKIINWVKVHKAWTALIALIWVIIIIVTAGGGSQKPKTTANNTSKQQKASTAASQNSEKPPVSFQLVQDESSSSANQSTGVYVVDPSAVNTTVMPAFCKWLSGVAKGEPQYFYGYVYDNENAAEMLKIMQSGNDTAAQDAQYDPHFIVIYTKSPQLNQCTISYKGVQDPNPQTINY